MVKGKSAIAIRPGESAGEGRLDDQSAFDTRTIHRAIERRLNREVGCRSLSGRQRRDDNGRRVRIREILQGPKNIQPAIRHDFALECGGLIYRTKQGGLQLIHSEVRVRAQEQRRRTGHERAGKGSSRFRGVAAPLGR